MKIAIPGKIPTFLLTLIPEIFDSFQSSWLTTGESAKAAVAALSSKKIVRPAARAKRLIYVLLV